MGRKHVYDIIYFILRVVGSFIKSSSKLSVFRKVNVGYVALLRRGALQKRKQASSGEERFRNEYSQPQERSASETKTGTATVACTCLVMHFLPIFQGILRLLRRVAPKRCTPVSYELRYRVRHDLPEGP